MSTSRRTHEQARRQMREGILRVANEHLEKHGSASLSLRAVARQLGVVPSALYRHVASRDELLTLLVVHAYGCLADEAQSAIADGNAAPAVRLRAVTAAMRGWAVANPARWALLYGTPVPGYSAPATETTAQGTRVIVTFVGILAQGTVPAAPCPSPGLSQVLARAMDDVGIHARAPLAIAAITAFTSLVGMISAEIFHQLGPDLSTFGEEQLRMFTEELITRFHLT